MDNESTTLPPVTDLQSAALHIEGLLDLTESSSEAPSQGRSKNAAVSDPPEDAADNASQSESADAESADTTQDESPASGDDEPEVIEPGDEAPPIIEPPASWNAQEKELFRSLPLDAQQIIGRRESERDTAISQRMNQLAEQRKAIEAQVAQANQAQTQYAQTLNQLLSLTIPELVEIENTDWVHLANTDRDEFNRRQAVERSLKQRVAYMQNQMSQVQQQQHQALLAQHKEHLAHQYQVLVEQVPEFRDADKAKALVNDIGQTMHTFGFSPEEIGSVADARIVRVMARLAQLEKLEAARRSALAKKSSQPAPRTMTPNATPTREDNRNRKMQEQYSALKRSGSLRDAAALIENIL